MTYSVKLNWLEGLKFDVTVSEGRKIELNSSERLAQAFSPMELFLVALAGCTAMDVAWIMERQRQKLERFEVSVQGIRRSDDPKYYETISLEYVVAGENIKKEALERAIRLSQEKYCSVRAMLNQKVNLKTSYRIMNGHELKEMAAGTVAPVS